jgi:hypothetical protein
MKNFIIFIGLLTIGFGSYAVINPNAKPIVADTSFEGIITFTKKTGAAESTYKYYVKGDNVRVEELMADGTIQGIMLVNTKDKTVKALSPERMVYMDVPSKGTFTATSVTVDKKDKAKTILDYSCKEWIASSKSEDRKITYWMAFDNYDFFIPFLKTINRKDKQSVYFLAMTETSGAFPMLSIETKTDGTELSRLTVSSVDKKTLDDSNFTIPSNYKKM